MALQVWPELTNQLGLNVEDADNSAYGDDDNAEWIINKMAALLHAMSKEDGTSGPLSDMVDMVMLARLIIEEQRLDDGRNAGRGGKYGGKFHPQMQQPQSGANNVDSKADRDGPPARR